jgi:isoquinoline 1-oxidoreductase
VQSKPPLRHGSYRALASSANTFARESAMDELAAIARIDPLEFRLKHLEEVRLRDVLQAAATRFTWTSRRNEKKPNVGVGIACGADKGSVVATCVEVAVDPEKKLIKLLNITCAFECGPIMNPAEVMKQVRGGLVMGIGPALREQIKFENGKVTNASLWEYEVPRFADVPPIDIELLDRPEMPAVGAGETPIIALAPAIANAVQHAAGVRVREMPIRSQ